jgi:DNA polymerase-3 subunit alpha
MLDTWKGLMGLPRHAGMHASGLVVSSESLVEHLPLRQEEGRTILQYTMHHINDFGFIKFDLLGVETLDTIFETAKEVGINIKEIPLDDKEVYEMIGRGQVTGLFQLDASKTCIDICKRFKPQNIRDIADIMALNRPGILDADLLETYLRRRSGHEKVTFLHPDLEKILEPTFGICLYQEDLMRMAAAYAGYTPLEVEDLRKGIGKKDMAIIDKHVAIFREKARTLGRDPKEIETVLEQVEAAGRYSFNASHALSYSLVSYACGYLAVHYPLNFFKNLINHSNNEERRSYLSQMLMRKLPLLPPDINVSEPNISIEKEAMRLGLLLIEGIGPAHVKTIMEHRPYSSIKEVSVRLSKSLVALLYAAHALDSLPDIGTYHPLVKLDEVEILGIPLSGLKGEFEDVINFISPVSIADVTDVDTCLIKVTDFKKHVQKDGKTMLFIQGFDVFGPKIESLMLFGNTLEKLTIKVEKNKVYGMLIRKLSGSGYCVNDLNSVENIRKLIDVQKND